MSTVGLNIVACLIACTYVCVCNRGRERLFVEHSKFGGFLGANLHFSTIKTVNETVRGVIAEMSSHVSILQYKKYRVSPAVYKSILFASGHCD